MEETDRERVRGAEVPVGPVELGMSIRHPSGLSRRQRLELKGWELRRG